LPPSPQQVSQFLRLSRRLRLLLTPRSKSDLDSEVSVGRQGEKDVTTHTPTSRRRDGSARLSPVSARLPKL
jgi:hypothetical protein